MSYGLMILSMALVTFVVKAGLFVAGDRIVFPRLLREALDFVPIAVLTAIVVPMVLAPGGGGAELTWRNPHLIGALTAVALAALTGRQLLTIVVALTVFFAWQFGVLA